LRRAHTGFFEKAFFTYNVRIALWILPSKK
jgi:hypothetical protein